MEVFHPRYLSCSRNTLNAFGCLPPSFVDLSFITDRALKRNAVGRVVLTGVRVLSFRGNLK